MAASPIRVRFAPSPTGFLHLGSARTALFNWLWARHCGGEFLVRIEDTDAERSRPELIVQVFDTLRWLGLDWDEAPVFQSQRAVEHDEAVERLLEVGAAYRCDCTRDDLDRRIAARGGGPPGYDGHCRDRAVPAAAPHAVRFRVPDDGETGWDDVIRGPVSFEHRNLEDFVVRRTNGSPTFILANAVDDAAMGVTDVIRGEDLLNTTPKVLLVRRALGVASVPVLAHVPLIVSESRKKLSKRRDAVAVEDYRDRGFLPEAMVNYLALLGWGPPDGVEVRPVEEIVELFDIADIGPSPAAFDLKKLEAVDGDHIRALAIEDFVARSRPFLESAPWAGRVDDATFRAIAPEVQTRVRTLAEVPELVDFLFLDEPAVDPAAWEKAISTNEAAPALLDAALGAYEGVEWDAPSLHAATLGLAEAAGLKLGKAQGPIRVAVTGRSVGPPLFESLALLGRDETLERLRAARARC